MSYLRLKHDLEHIFPTAHHPALEKQFKQWEKDKPLKNVRILDATPPFLNSHLKYANLLAAGAELTVGISPWIPSNPIAVESLQKYEIPTEIFSEKENKIYDIILDCGAIYRNRNVKMGFVELTRSGAIRYKDAPSPVFNVDDSAIKELETSLGTGESFLRAMRFKGYEIENKHFIIFGYGKVGRGIAMFLYEAHANVTIVDDISHLYIPKELNAIDLHDLLAIQNAVDHADGVISVTGIQNALQGQFNLQKLMKSNTLMINMGIENEFGPEVIIDRVLNKNRPFNFILEQPTLLPYIDPTMALHNEGALALLENKCHLGLNAPSTEICNTYLQAVYEANIISNEIKRMQKWKNQF